jgi:hypothetical protein
MKLRTVSTGVMGLAMLTVLGTGCDHDAIKASADKATAAAQRAESAAARAEAAAGRVEAAAAKAEAAADKASSRFHHGLKK